MQVCKACRALIIGDDATEWLPRLVRLLKHHGAEPETITVVAESLGPMCHRCLKAMDKSIREE